MAYCWHKLRQCQGTIFQWRFQVPSVLRRCCLGGRKGIRPLKTERWGAGVVICLGWGAGLHMAQLMPLPLTVSCFSKIQIGFTFLVPAHPGFPGQIPQSRKTVVCCVVCYCNILKSSLLHQTNNNNNNNNNICSTALCPGLNGWASTLKVKPIWILLKQETVIGSGISWAICKPAPHPRQITTPAPYHSFLTGRMSFLLPNQQHQSIQGNPYCIKPYKKRVVYSVAAAVIFTHLKKSKFVFLRPMQQRKSNLSF